MNLLTSFRIQEPLLFFTILAPLLALLLVGSRYQKQTLTTHQPSFKKLVFIVNAGLILTIVSYILLVILYIFNNTFFDQAEPNIAAVSWLFKTGKPLFPPMDSADRYINNYGAVLYIINRFFLEILGPSILAVKLGCGLAALAAVGCIFYAASKVASRQIALIACAYAVLACLSITNSFAFHAASFWLRPDPMLIFFVSVALLGVLRGNRTVAAIVAALAFGCSLNLKINAFVNFLPIYFLLAARYGLTVALAAGAGAIAVAAAPFLMYQQISWNDYITWLSQSRHKPVYPGQLFEVSKWVFYITLPILLSLGYLLCRSRTSFYDFIRRNRGFVYSLLGCVIASLAFSHKIGVLENNHLPLVPLFAYLLALVLEWIRTENPNFPVKKSTSTVRTVFISAALALAITMPLAIAPEAARLVSSLIKSPSNQIISDIEGVMAAYPDAKISMGFSQGPGNYELTYYRPILVFNGNPYLVDPVIMFEMQVSGVETVTEATIDALKACQTDIWLMPKVTQTPFDLRNFYPPEAPIFPKAFQQTFLQNHERFGESKFYDLWRCRR